MKKTTNKVKEKPKLLSSAMKVALLFCGVGRGGGYFLAGLRSSCPARGKIRCKSIPGCSEGSPLLHDETFLSRRECSHLG